MSEQKTQIFLPEPSRPRCFGLVSLAVLAPCEFFVSLFALLAIHLFSETLLCALKPSLGFFMALLQHSAAQASPCDLLQAVKPRLLPRPPARASTTGLWLFCCSSTGFIVSSQGNSEGASKLAVGQAMKHCQPYSSQFMQHSANFSLRYGQGRQSPGQRCLLSAEGST